MTEEIRSKFGRLDGIFANAGVLGDFSQLVDTDVSSLEDLLQTNLIGTSQTLLFCLPLLESGAIVLNESWTVNTLMPGAGHRSLRSDQVSTTPHDAHAGFGIRASKHSRERYKYRHHADADGRGRFA